MSEPRLTPTEELLMEVLAGRTRLGHESKGLIWTMHGAVEKTFRAGLTDEGKALQMDDPNYVAPILGGPK